MRFIFVDLMKTRPYDCDTPYTTGIGGTQSALCYYAEALAKTGDHEVHVVTTGRTEAAKVRGVFFQPEAWLSAGLRADVVVFTSGVSLGMRALLKKMQAGLSIAWIPHNTNESSVSALEDVLYDFDAFAFVSDWQRQKYIDLYGIHPAKTMLMENGVAPGFLGDFDVTAKKPIFLYLSQPDRGLSIVADGWPRIAAAWPTAELHTYSSRSLYGGEDTEGTRALFERLRTLPRVAVHAPVGQADLVQRCREAAFFAYPTNYYETGCIALTEACAAGCLPLVSNLGALGTYFNNCLPFDETIVERFVERACESMALFTAKPVEFYAASERVALRFQTERGYDGLVAAFLRRCVDLHAVKQHALACLQRAVPLFGAGKYRDVRLQLDNMAPLFASQDHVFQYFLWLGVCHYHAKSHHNAALYFNKASRWGKTLQLCINQILTHEALKNVDEMIKWCEQALTHKFDMNIVGKILNVIQSKPYFDRCKWGKYLLSLWNDDIHDTNWMTIFMSHGNMVVADYMLVGKHEEGMVLLTNLLQKAYAYVELHKIDVTAPTQMRNNIEKLFTNLFLNMNYFETRNPEHWRYVEHFMKKLPTAILPHVFPSLSPRAGRKTRIGFLSGDLIYHPVSYILTGIVEHLNKDTYDVHVYTTSEKKPDNLLQNKIRREATKYVDLQGGTVASIKDAIVADDVDLLIEMTGHTSTGTDLLNVVRHKPARVVAQYFAFPNTYGIPQVDYKIGDKHVFPAGLERYYVEGFCKIKGGLHTYHPIKPQNVMRTEHAGIVFGCTNNPKKYRLPWIRCVAAILKRIPDSRLKCRYQNLNDPSIQEYYRKEFEKHGISRSRLDLDYCKDYAAYLPAYADMDICLDPFPYNGGTINIETLYAGLPYITLLGTSYVSRVGASLLHQVGHPELIAKTEEAYVEYAVALAGDKDRLDTYKATLRDDMMKSTLGDNKAFTREFEVGCEWMLKEKGF